MKRQTPPPGVPIHMIRQELRNLHLRRAAVARMIELLERYDQLQERPTMPSARVVVEFTPARCLAS